MENQFHSGTPIYLQLEKAILHRIVSGELQPGQKLESVRDLAIGFQVNPNTVQRALTELERRGLLYTERTSGRFVTDNKGSIISAREEAAQGIVNGFLRDMEGIGFTPEETVDLMSKEAQRRRNA